MSNNGTAKRPPRPRGTTTEIERRRQQVFKLTLRGVPQGTIADMIGVHKNTVHRDVEAIRKKLRSRTQEADVYLEIGQMTEAFDEISKLALIEFTSTKDPKIKNFFLGTALRAIANKGDLLLRTGVLPSAAKKVEMDAKLQAALVQLDAKYEPMRPILDDPSRRRKVLGLFERLVSVGGKDVLELGEVIDGETVSSQEASDSSTPEGDDE